MAAVLCAVSPHSYQATGGLAIKELHRRQVLKQYLEARKFGFGKAALIHKAQRIKGTGGGRLPTFLFDTFLSCSQTYYKRMHDFHYGRACHCAGVFFFAL